MMRTGVNCLPCMESTQFTLIPVGYSNSNNDTANTTAQLRLSSNASGAVSLSSHRWSWDAWTLTYPYRNNSINSVAGDTSSCVPLIQSMKYRRVLGFERTKREIKTFERRNEDDQNDAESESCFFSIKETMNEGYYILYCEDTLTKLSYDSEKKSLSLVKMASVNDDEDTSSLWRLEFESGELCFLSHTVSDRRLSCGLLAEIFPSKNWQGWEVWRFIEAGQGNVLITSWYHNNKDLLCSSENGTLYTRQPRQIMKDPKAAADALWRVEKECASSDLGVVIRSVTHDRLLTKRGNKFETTKVVEDSSYSECRWMLEPANLSVFYLTNTALQQRLSCRGKDCMLSMAKTKYSTEQWEVRFTPEGDGLVTVQLKASFGFGKRKTTENQFLTYTSESDVVCVGQSPCYWRLVESNRKDGTMCLMTADHIEDRYLYCGADCSLSVRVTSLENAEEQNAASWVLEPCMPLTVNGNQLGIMAAVGASAVLLTAATPFAVVGALGVGLDGIIAGTIGTSVAFGGLLGGTIASAKIVLRPARGSHGKMSQKDMMEENGFQRPFAAWRNW